MTREEAIQYLIKPVATSTEIGEEKQKEFEAYDMAISALSAGGDLISRDALMKQLDERYCKPCQSRKEDYNGVRCRACWVDDAVGEIEDAPSAEPMRSRCEVDAKSDLISRADAIGAVQDHFNDDGFKGYDDGQKMMDRIKALPSAELPNLKQEFESAEAVHKPDYSYEADMVKRLREYEQGYRQAQAEAVKVAYICDGRKCDSDCSECFRTLDIEHARDFTLMGDTYFQQPSADRPTFVRCKDCRWWQGNNNGYPHANCHWCETETPDEDDFCSLGERKGGGDE